MTSTHELVQYSEKSFVVFGDTKAIKNKLKELGGKYNRNLVDPRTGNTSPGWVFSHKKHTLVSQELASPVTVNSTKNTFAKSQKSHVQKSHVQKTEKSQVQKPQGATKSPVQKTEKTRVQKPRVSESVHGPYFKALEHGMCRELAQKYQDYFNKKRKFRILDGHVKHKIQHEAACMMRNEVLSHAPWHCRPHDRSWNDYLLQHGDPFNCVQQTYQNKPVLKFHDYLTSKLLGGKEIAGNANNNVINPPRNCGLNKRVILHELSHTCDNPHHDIKFRQDHVTLVKAFLGKTCK